MANASEHCHHTHFLPIPLTSTTFWRVLMAFSRTGSTDCMIPSLLSISLIYGCIPSMAFIFLATSTSGCPSSSLFKILAVSAFKSQFYNPDSGEIETPISSKNFIESVKYRAQNLGRIIGTTAGEGFTSKQQLSISNIFDLIR